MRWRKIEKPWWCRLPVYYHSPLVVVSLTFKLFSESLLSCFFKVKCGGMLRPLSIWQIKKEFRLLCATSCPRVKHVTHASRCPDMIDKATFFYCCASNRMHVNEENTCTERQLNRSFGHVPMKRNAMWWFVEESVKSPGEKWACFRTHYLEEWRVFRCSVIVFLATFVKIRR